MLRRNGAEAGTDSLAVTVANSGGASGDAWSSVTIGLGGCTYSTGQANPGSVSYQLWTGLLGAQVLLTWDSTALGTPARLYGRTYLRLANPAQARDLARWRAGTTQVARLRISATGKLELRASTNAAPTSGGTGTVTLAADTWYRIEWDIRPGATATNTILLYAGDTTIPLETITGTGGFSSGTIVDEVSLGNATVAALLGYAWYDGAQVNDTGLPGPATTNVTGPAAGTGSASAAGARTTSATATTAAAGSAAAQAAVQRPASGAGSSASTGAGTVTITRSAAGSAAADSSAQAAGPLTGAGSGALSVTGSAVASLAVTRLAAGSAGSTGLSTASSASSRSSAGVAAGAHQSIAAAVTDRFGSAQTQGASFTQATGQTTRGASAAVSAEAAAQAAAVTIRSVTGAASAANMAQAVAETTGALTSTVAAASEAQSAASVVRSAAGIAAGSSGVAGSSTRESPGTGSTGTVSAAVAEADLQAHAVGGRPGSSSSWAEAVTVRSGSGSLIGQASSAASTAAELAGTGSAAALSGAAASGSVHGTVITVQVQVATSGRAVGLAVLVRAPRPRATVARQPARLVPRLPGGEIFAGRGQLVRVVDGVIIRPEQVSG